MMCPNCRNENLENARFCLQCGAPLPKKPSAAARFFSAILHAVLYFFLFFGVQFIVEAFYLFIMCFRLLFSRMREYSYTLPDSVIEEVTEQIQQLLYQNIHILLILSAVIILLILCISFRIRHKNPLEEMHIRKARPVSLLLCLVLGCALQVFTCVTLAFIPFPQSALDALEQNNSLIENGSLLIQLVSVVIVTPILEELIFRGLIFTRLRRGMPVAAAVILSAAIFGIAHGNPIGFVYAGCLGIALALLMLKNNDSILPAVCCHAGFNGISFLMTGLPENPALILALYVLSFAVMIVCIFLMFRKKSVPDAGAENDH